MIEIQPGFADCANPRVRGEGGELRDGIGWRFVHIARMNADARVDHRGIRDRKVGVQIVKAGRQRDQAADPGGAGAIYQAGCFRRRETMGSEVAMGIGEHGSYGRSAASRAVTLVKSL